MTTKQKRLTIYDIKYLTMDTAPHFFTRSTLKFWGQTLKDFSVYKEKDGRFYIVAPQVIGGRTVGYTERYFNPETNKLENK